MLGENVTKLNKAFTFIIFCDNFLKSKVTGKCYL